MITRFIDATLGSDSNDGTHPNKAWLTFTNLIAGATLLKGGEKWRETLTVPADSCTIGQYGGSNLPAPEISGADLLTTPAYRWIESGNGTNEWYVELAAGGDPSLTEPKRIYMDNTLLVVGTIGTLEDHEWGWGTSGGETAFSTVFMRDNSGDPDTSGVVVDAAQRASCIKSTDNSDITLDGIITERANSGLTDGCISFVSATNDNSDITIRNCEAREGWRAGIHFGYTGSGAIINALVNNCDVHDNGGNGVVCGTLWENFILEYCRLYNNCKRPFASLSWLAGARIVKGASARSTGTIFRYNESYDNGIPGREDDNGHGLWIDAPGDDAHMYGNICYGNQETGLYFEWGSTNTDHSVYSNISHNNGRGGILVSRRTHGVLVHNNTCYENGPPFGDIMVIGEAGGDPEGMVDNIVRNNICWSAATLTLSAAKGGENDVTNGSGNRYENNITGSEHTNFMRLGESNYSTLASWEAAINANEAGSSSNNTTGDPLFENAAGANFGLKPTSPAIDTGVDVGLDRDYAGTKVPQGRAPDIGAIERKVRKPGAGGMTGSRSRKFREESLIPPLIVEAP